jgi:hypothetical protein
MNVELDIFGHFWTFLDIFGHLSGFPRTSKDEIWGFFLKKYLTIIIFLKKLFYAFIIYSRQSKDRFWGFFSSFLTDQKLLRLEVFLRALTTDRAKNSFLRICFSLGGLFLFQGTFVVSSPSNRYEDSFGLL